MAPACPECGREVVFDLACHTWPQRRPDGSERFMTCMPCDSAIEYTCTGALGDEERCGWSYTHGLNPRNPRAAANEARRPVWLEGVSHVHRGKNGFVMTVAVDGARPLWDFPDREG